MTRNVLVERAFVLTSLVESDDRKVLWLAPCYQNNSNVNATSHHILIPIFLYSVFLYFLPKAHKSIDQLFSSATSLFVYYVKQDKHLLCCCKQLEATSKRSPQPHGNSMLKISNGLEQHFSRWLWEHNFSVFQSS